MTTPQRPEARSLFQTQFPFPKPRLRSQFYLLLVLIIFYDEVEGAQVLALISEKITRMFHL